MGSPAGGARAGVREGAARAARVRTRAAFECCGRGAGMGAADAEAGTIRTAADRPGRVGPASPGWSRWVVGEGGSGDVEWVFGFGELAEAAELRRPRRGGRPHRAGAYRARGRGRG